MRFVFVVVEKVIGQELLLIDGIAACLMSLGAYSLLPRLFYVIVRKAVVLWELSSNITLECKCNERQCCNSA